MKKIIAGLLCAAMIFSTMSGCTSSAPSTADGASTGGITGDKTESVTLTYMIWDTNQLDGMKQIADQFMVHNPNITVNVQVTPWDASMQYWMKLEASAKSGAMPDVFWMHADQIAQYVSGNTLMDLTDKVAENPEVAMSNYPTAVVATSMVNDKIYAIPKDYTDFALWYNKTMFDAAEIAYPDNTWTWDTMFEAAKDLTDTSKGQYGFLAKEDGQNLYWNFIWQNGGTVISDDKKSSGFDQPAAQDAIAYLLNFIELGYSPTQEQFANTSPQQYMESGNAAMGVFGSQFVAEFEGNDYMKSNCDLAVLPKGKVRATNLNGLSNSIALNTKYPDQSWEFVKYMGTKEANEIQGKSGAAIPAYAGTAQTFVDTFDGFNLQAFIDQVGEGLPSPVTPSKPTWSQYEQDTMSKVFAFQLPIKEGMDDLAKQVNETIATESE
ncbi:MAG: sugar ABC transporter substrate-binding protein [Acetanaerobacterium sp.]